MVVAACDYKSAFAVFVHAEHTIRNLSMSYHVITINHFFQSLFLTSGELGGMISKAPGAALASANAKSKSQISPL
jgi:hypothetical protein